MKQAKHPAFASLRFTTLWGEAVKQGLGRLFGADLAEKCALDSSIEKRTTHMTTTAETTKLAALGAKFRAQQTGRKPGALFWTIHRCALRAGRPYKFADVLNELSLAAMCREALGKHTEVLEVDRESEVVRFELPRRGLVDVPLGTVRNVLTRVKKKLNAEIHTCP